mgnify:CR=1 FL=1
MAFLFGKKKSEPTSCGCASGCSTPAADNTGAAILILGGGCANCQALERAVRAAMDIREEVGHVTDFAQIAAYGVLTTPALVVDGQVLSAGQVLSVEQAKALLAKVRG